MYTYDYPRPMVTVDIVVFAADAYDAKHVLLVRRGKPPFKGSLAIPGGFLDMARNETCLQAAIREVYEETGWSDESQVPRLLMVADGPDRDPRGRVISLVYIVQIGKIVDVQGDDDAAEALWVPIDQVYKQWPLAFDHDQILMTAFAWHEKNRC